jgi:hypothetical protein
MQPSRPDLASRRQALLLAFGAGLCVMASLAQAQSAAGPTERVRGTVMAVDAGTLTVQAQGGERIELVLPESLVVSEVYPITLADIRPGSYIGTAAMPQADGSQRAIAVTVFPEAARGTGDGHRPFDLMPQSTMTNATVEGLVSSPDGRRLSLRHKDGTTTVVVPEDAPVVTFVRADRRSLVVGASVSLTARLENGRPTVQRVSVGRNGFVLPY